MDGGRGLSVSIEPISTGAAGQAPVGEEARSECCGQFSGLGWAILTDLFGDQFP